MTRNLIAGLFIICVLPTLVCAQGLPDSANLKLLKTKSKLLTLRNTGQLETTPVYDPNLTLSGECGGIQIGNSPATQRSGKDLTIVITGDVINAGNSRCR